MYAPKQTGLRNVQSIVNRERIILKHVAKAPTIIFSRKISATGSTIKRKEKKNKTMVEGVRQATKA